MQIEDLDIPNYERVVQARDEASGLHAIIAVHNTTLGPALGGMRMLPYKSTDEALTDVLRLSKGMTYKSAVANTGLGGGKCVVIGDPKKHKSEALFQNIGRFVNSLEGKYITAEDMNIGIPDLEIVQQETKYVSGLSREAGSSGNPSPYTAYGCLVGVRATAKEAFGTDDLTGKRVLVQGVGAVGGRLAILLKEAGAKVTICDINDARVAQLQSEHGFDIVDDSLSWTLDGVENNVVRAPFGGSSCADEGVAITASELAAADTSANSATGAQRCPGEDDDIIWDEYTATANAGDIVTVSVDTTDAGNAFDSLLVVLAPSGCSVINADDSFDCEFAPADFQCSGAEFEAPEDGTYRFLVANSGSCIDDSAAGAYRVNSSQADLAAGEVAQPTGTNTVELTSTINIAVETTFE